MRVYREKRGLTNTNNVRKHYHRFMKRAEAKQKKLTKQYMKCREMVAYMKQFDLSWRNENMGGR